MIDRIETKKKKNVSLFFSASAVTFLFQDGGESTSRGTNQREPIGGGVLQQGSTAHRHSGGETTVSATNTVSLTPEEFHGHLYSLLTNTHIIRAGTGAGARLVATELYII